MERFDLAVLGAGPGGYPAAIRASQSGAAVVLVEKEELGGACLNWGCIPSKTLLSSARLFREVQSAGKLGIQCGEPRVDYAALIDHKDQVVGKLRSGVRQLLTASGVRILRGTASFRTRRILEVRSEGEPDCLIQAEKTIIAVGAGRETGTGLPGHERILDSRSFLELTDLPSSVVILGGSIVGFEYACLLGQFGTRVTLVAGPDEIFDSVDSDLFRELKRHMENSLGVRIVAGSVLRDVKPGDDSVRVLLGDELMEAEFLVDASGRLPATAGLGLDRAGVRTDAGGFIPVDPYGQTSAAGTYAIGDVTGGLPLAQAATSQGLTAAGNAFGRERRTLEKLVPCCIFTAPEIAAVGLSERRAESEGRRVRTGKFRLGALGKAAITRTGGFVKWVADAGTLQLLGAAAAGPAATEMIGEAVVAIREELTAEEIARTSHAHPTLSEAWFEAASTLINRPLHSVPGKSRPEI